MNNCKKDENTEYIKKYFGKDINSPTLQHGACSCGEHIVDRYQWVSV